MRDTLNEVETDCIEFLSEKTNRPPADVEESFLATRKRFKFHGLGYRDLCVTIYRLSSVLYDDGDEAATIESYKFHELINLFRFVSYSYGKRDPGFFDCLGHAARAVFKGELRDLYLAARKKLAAGRGGPKPTGDYVAIAKLLVKAIQGPPVVVDYGCGLGYISFEIGKLDERSRIYLLDIDCLTLRFAEFRFRKHGISTEVVPVTKNDVYPKLPKHNICVATEVMEHLSRPLLAYQNVCDSLEPGGILHGEFHDHHGEMFHVSPDLSELRRRISEDFEAMGCIGYRRLSDAGLVHGCVRRTSQDG